MQINGLKRGVPIPLKFATDHTRGLTANAGGGVPAGNGLDNAGGVPGVPDGNGVATVDHAVRLFSAYVAYDMHPCGYEKGCGSVGIQRRLQHARGLDFVDDEIVGERQSAEGDLAKLRVLGC